MPRYASGTAKTGAERVAAYRARKREARLAQTDVTGNGNGNGNSNSNSAPKPPNEASRSGNGNGNGSTEIADLENQLAKVVACLRELEAECQRYRNELVRYRTDLARNRNGETVTSAPSGATIRQAREDRDQRIRELLAEGRPVIRIAREVGSTVKVIHRVRRELAAAPDTGQPQTDHV
jgi:hypothetical protein